MTCTDAGTAFSTTRFVRLTKQCLTVLSRKVDGNTCKMGARECANEGPERAMGDVSGTEPPLKGLQFDIEDSKKMLDSRRLVSVG